MPLKCHSDALEKPDAILRKQMHRISVRLLTCMLVLPGTVVMI